MSHTIERQQGAARFTKTEPQLPMPSEAVLFTKPDFGCLDDDWDMIVKTALSSPNSTTTGMASIQSRRMLSWLIWP